MSRYLWMTALLLGGLYGCAGEDSATTDPATTPEATAPDGGDTDAGPTGPVVPEDNP